MRKTFYEHGKKGQLQEGQLVDEFVTPSFTRDETEELYHILLLAQRNTRAAVTSRFIQQIRQKLLDAETKANE